MKHFAVLGQPVAHSLSPQIQHWFAEQLKLPLRYEAIEVSAEDFAERLQQLHADKYDGLNITLPHKVAALSLCADHSPGAELAGAANTLMRADDGWRAANTDGEGLVRDLLDNLNVSLADKRVLLMGAGGAVRGVLDPLLQEQPRELVLASRTPWKTQALATDFKDSGTIRPCTYAALKGDQFDVVINATSAGHSGQVPRLPEGLLAPKALCYDLSYGPAHLPFRAWAMAQRAKVVSDGLGMLVEQAASAFSLWLGQRPRTARVIKRLRER